MKKLPSLFLEPVGKGLIKNEPILDSKRSAASALSSQPTTEMALEIHKSMYRIELVSYC